MNARTQALRGRFRLEFSATILLAGLLVIGGASTGAGTATASSGDLLRGYEAHPEEFEQRQIGDKLVYFKQRIIDGAIVEKDFAAYEFDSPSEMLTEERRHWREGLPDHVTVKVSKEEAESMAEGDIEFSELYILSPDSDVFPLEPTPDNPCWVVRSTQDGIPIVSIIDAVSGDFLGYGVPPPSKGFSLSGPMYSNPCLSSWAGWYENAGMWFEEMGYPTTAIRWPTKAEIRSAVRDPDVALFYEIAHGGSRGIASGCNANGGYDTVYPSDINSWIAPYKKMPFTFIGSCDGMCDVSENTFSYEFRKGSSTDTATVGYCGMGGQHCSSCWPNSLDWQDALLDYMSQGHSVKDAFLAALVDYPMCASAPSCMRFAGDPELAVVGSEPVAYTNDFEESVGPEWSHRRTEATPIGSRRFLGQFGNETVSLVLGDLQPHDGVTVSFDLFVIRTWDGNRTDYECETEGCAPDGERCGPDKWQLAVRGGRTLLSTTFSNGYNPKRRQAYPDTHPGGDYPARTGAIENDTLGYVFDEDPHDAVYRLSFSFGHSSSTLALEFSAAGLQCALADESWGIDNVEVRLNGTEGGCASNSECLRSEYCAKVAGDCAGVGTCEERPITCTAVVDPVCGCDGKTYANSCVAAIVGVNVAREGSCTGRFELNVTKRGNGNGTVFSSPSGIHCGQDCQEVYNQNTLVTLTPRPDDGSIFVGWEGDEDCRDGKVIMREDRRCSATFNKDSANSLMSVSDCSAGPGGVAMCEVELSLESGVEVTTLQFNATVEPGEGAPPISDEPVTFTVDTSLPPPSLNQNPTPATVLVGWFSPFSPRLSGDRSLGVLSVPVPTTAESGETYRLRMVAPSATSDGVRDVAISPGTDGTLRVSSTPFRVCDVTPTGRDKNGDGDTFDAGEFGNGAVTNGDVVAIFRCSLLPEQCPPAGSDRFNAMDAAGEDEPPRCGGNGSIINSDVVMCFRRSLLSTLPHYERSRAGGACTSTRVEGSGGGGSLSSSVHAITRARTHSAVATDGMKVPRSPQLAGIVIPRVPAKIAKAGKNVSVPLRLKVLRGIDISTLQLAVRVSTPGESPALVEELRFSAASGRVAPQLEISEGSELLLGWLDRLPALRGRGVKLGKVTFQLPSTALEGDEYLVEILAPSGTSSEGEGLVLVGGTLRVPVGAAARRPDRLRLRCDHELGRRGGLRMRLEESARCWLERRRPTRRTERLSSAMPVNTDMFWVTDAPQMLTLEQGVDGSLVINAKKPGKAYIYAIGGSRPSLHRLTVRVGAVS